MAGFLYSRNESYEDNFQRWWLANSLLAEMHTQEPYTEDYARKLFDYYYGVKNEKSNT